MTMAAVLFVLALAQDACTPVALALLSDASAQAQAFEMRGALERLDAAAARGCRDGEIGAVYIRGLIAARDAFSQGAPPESLLPVRTAIAALETAARGRPGPA